MEENILRIVQLVLALNEENMQGSPIQCRMSIQENGYIEVKAVGLVESFQETGTGSKHIYEMTEFAKYQFSTACNDGLAAKCLERLENICHDTGINVNERYRKVKVC